MGRNNSSKNILKKQAYTRVKAIENNPHRHNKEKEITKMVSSKMSRFAVNRPEFHEKYNHSIRVSTTPDPKMTPN